MKRYRVAAIIIIIHGFIELVGFFSVLPTWLFRAGQGEIIPFEPSSAEVVFAGAFWGILRLIAGIALFKNKMWGLAFSMITCSIVLATMLTISPLGVMDGILASSALILMLTQYFGKKKIIE